MWTNKVGIDLMAVDGIHGRRRGKRGPSVESLSKHQIRPWIGRIRRLTDAGRDGRTRLAGLIFPVRLTTSRIVSHNG